MEDDAIAFLVAGAHEDAGDDADAHSADTAEVDAPGITGGFHRVQRGRVRQFIECHVRQHVSAAMLADHRHLLEAGAGFDGGAEFIADGDTLAGAVVHTQRQIRVDLAAIIRLDRRQAGTGGLLGAFQAILADLRRDIHVRLFREIPFFLDRLPLIAAFGAVIGDAALFVGNDDFNAIGEDRFFKHAFVARAVGGAEFGDGEGAGAGHAADDGFDVLQPGVIAEHILFGAGMFLMAGHRGGAVFKNDVGEILPVLDAVADGDLAGVKESAIAHEDDLFVGDERVDAAAGAAAEPHAGVVMHELFGGGEHEHGVATGVTVRDEIDGGEAVLVHHVFGVGEVFSDFEEGGR